ncbi:hypothetical protein TNCV_801871 [Trichonephila clavipes]|nr:hypothetical protein TNCV_801871 [Trichonephila clavipes]
MPILCDQSPRRYSGYDPQIVTEWVRIPPEAVGSLVVRTSDSRLEGLGSMPDAAKYPPSTCSLNQWVRSPVGLVTSAGTGEYFPPLQFPCRNCGGIDRGGVAIYRCFGEFSGAKSYCHLYGAQGKRQVYL